MAVAAADPPEWARRINKEVAGRCSRDIATRSPKAASRFADVNPSLKPQSLDASTLSRYRRGVEIGKPRFEKLVTLKLILIMMDDPANSEWAEADLRAVLKQAADFAQSICEVAATSACTADPLHSLVPSGMLMRVRDLLGDYGNALLRQAADSGNSGRPRPSSNFCFGWAER